MRTKKLNLKSIDNKRFVMRVFAVMIPIMLQNGITNFVNMLDNVMVGNIGTAEMTGVSVAGSLIFIYNLCVFGAVSGAGIFGAQFYGKGDVEGVRQTLRFKMIMSLVITAAASVVIVFFGDSLTVLFLEGEGDPAVAEAALASAHEYLMIMLVSLVPFAIVQCWTSTLRECDMNVLPMAAGFAAMGVNLVLNWILIFGNLGAPKMGVAGAAVATVVSRFVELGVVVVGSYIKRERAKFVTGLFRRFNIAPSLMKNILVKGFPMIVNETMWAAGYTTLNRYYSTRGLDVVAANNINITFFNVFSCTFFALGVAVGIIMGQMLGAGNIEEAKRRSNTLLIISAIMSTAVGAVYGLIAPIVPNFYNTTDSVRHIATVLMIICAAFMPFESLTHTEYFTIRSGGKAFLTMVFDSGFMWVLVVPTVILLAKLTDMSVFWLYAVVQILNVVKCAIGFAFVKSGHWATNIVGKKQEGAA